MAMVQLLLGNIGVAGGGMNALRGHSNGYVCDDIEPDPKAYMAYSSAAERPLSKPITAARSCKTDNGRSVLAAGTGFHAPHRTYADGPQIGRGR